jgi:hypothetical protein
MSIICSLSITRFGTLYAESLLMYVKPVFITITQGGLKMIGKDFIITQTRCLLNEFIAPIVEKTDKPRQKYLRSSVENQG